MKAELKPWMVAVGIGAVAIGLFFWGYKATQPGGYVPSPGAGGRPFESSGYPNGGTEPPRPAGAQAPQGIISPDAGAYPGDR